MLGFKAHATTTWRLFFSGAEVWQGRWDQTLHNVPPKPFITTHNALLLHLQNNLFFELFPLQSLPFTFLCSQAVKKLLYLALPFRIPKREREREVNVTLHQFSGLLAFLLSEHQEFRTIHIWPVTMLPGTEKNQWPTSMVSTQWCPSPVQSPRSPFHDF